MFDLDKEVKKIKKMQKVELKERKYDKKFTRSSLDDALSVGILKLALAINQSPTKTLEEE